MKNLKNIIKNSRMIFFIIFLGSFLVLSTALYLQIIEKIEPCPLCISQRLIFICVLFTALVAFIHNPYNLGRKIYSLITSFFSLLGVAVAGYHSWIEMLPPDKIPPCGPSWEILVANFPIKDIIRITFASSGNCADISWKILGISLAGWSFLVFSLFTFLSLIIFLKSRNSC